MNWNKIRKDFPITKNLVYFQSAGMSPLPNEVLKEITKCYKKLNLYGDAYFMNDLNKTQKLYLQLAKLINTTPNNITFLPNNSIAMSVVALSLTEKHKQFNMVSVEDEFPSNTVPFEYKGIKMIYAKPDRNHRFSVENITSIINKNTVAVVTSYVQFCTGFRQNLEQLGKELKKRNILFIVNATQAFPLFNVDVKKCNIDVLTCSIHKWGFAGHVGTVFYTSEKFRKNYAPPIAGWLSVDTGNELIHKGKNTPFNLQNSALCYNTGTYNLQNLLGLKKSLEYLSEIGFKNIVSRIFELGDELIIQLKNINIKIVSPIEKKNERSAIISIDLGKNLNEKAVQFLQSHNIYTSLRFGMIRIALNIFNNFDDIKKLTNCLSKFVSKNEK